MIAVTTLISDAVGGVALIAAAAISARSAARLRSAATAREVAAEVAAEVAVREARIAVLAAAHEGTLPLATAAIVNAYETLVHRLQGQIDRQHARIAALEERVGES